MRQGSARARAGGAAALLLLTGVLLGVVLDRVLLMPTPADASPLTVESLAERIDLPLEDQARLRALLDSLHAEVVAAAAKGPAALRVEMEAAHERIEASLPPEARPEFRSWLHENRAHMMRRMHGDHMGRGMMRGMPEGH
jgi:hypothetical protein